MTDDSARKALPIDVLAEMVDRDFAIVGFFRTLFEEFGEVLRSHVRLRMGHFFLDAMGAWWFDSVTIAVRRMVDRSPNSISLYRLATRVQAEVKAGKTFVLADGGGVLTADEINADRTAMLKLSARARAIANRMIAHRDERGLEGEGAGLIWRGDLYATLDTLQPLLDKYVSLFVQDPQRAVYLYYAGWADEIFGIAWKRDQDQMGDFPSFGGARLVTRQRADELTQLWERLGYSTL